MVRVITKPEGAGEDGVDVDAAEELLQHAQATLTTKGSRGLLVVPLLSHRMHLGNPWDRWGFDNSFPMMLEDLLSFREWLAAMEGSSPHLSHRLHVEWVAAQALCSCCPPPCWWGPGGCRISAAVSRVGSVRQGRLWMCGCRAARV